MISPSNRFTEHLKDFLGTTVEVFGTSSRTVVQDYTKRNSFHFDYRLQVGSCCTFTRSFRLLQITSLLVTGRIAYTDSAVFCRKADPPLSVSRSLGVVYDYFCVTQFCTVTHVWRKKNFLHLILTQERYVVRSQEGCRTQSGPFLCSPIRKPKGLPRVYP